MNQKKRDFQISRIASFSDAIFGFAITLMVFDLKLPTFAQNVTLEEALSEISKSFPSLFGIMLSFFIIADFWKRHHQLFGFVDNYDKKLIGLNLMVLFSIILIPFTTSFLAKNIIIETNIPLIVYNLNIILVGIFNYTLSKYVFNPKNKICLVDNKIEKEIILRELKFPIAIFVLVMLLSFWNTFLAPSGYALMAFESKFSHWRIKKSKKIE